MLEKLLDSLFGYGESLFFALLAVIVGTILIKKVLLPLLEKMLSKGKADTTIKRFFMSFTTVALYIILVVIVMSYLHIDMTSAVALLGSCGVAIGLALQDTLANVAGGIFVLFTKPFVIGDFIETEGTQGTVVDITILHTKLDTVDNKAVFIPNNQMASNRLTNFSHEQNRRLDLVFSIAYSDDFRVAKEVIGKVADAHPLVLKDPAPIIRVGELAASSVDIFCRIWVPNASYWDVYYDMLEQVKLALDEAGLNIPFNQLDVHLKDK